ncbi:MAG TPA: cyclic peptide export ABC transporter [Candidatus Aquabacterium excrementipullorum]|nr:cyclic peptide export ABC transporter [Candidatus Aquabacterium excrementipullorum]
MASAPHTASSLAADLLRLLRPHLGWIEVSVFTGLCAGVATVGLLATVNSALHDRAALSGATLWIYLGLCGVALLGRGLSDMGTNRVGQRVVAQLRKDLAEDILQTPLEALERFGNHRLLPVLTQDVEIVSHFAFTLSATLISGAVTMGCLLYLAVLSPALFGLMLAALVVGTVIQVLAQARGMRGFWSARVQEEQLHRNYRTLSDGAKELRLHWERRIRLMGQITATVEAIRSVNGRAVSIYVLAKAFGAAIFFLLIALVLAWGAWQEVEPEVLSAFVLILLFLKGPIDQIATGLPTFGRARVALQRIEELRVHFARGGVNSETVGQSTTPAPTAMERIELRGVTYRFPAQKEEHAIFTLEPIDLELRKGEMVFIVGDNGAGKTTLVKLLLGLYAPTDGEILLDGQRITPEMQGSYRELFSTVLSDFYLFDDLVAQGRNAASLASQAERHLDRLGLGPKVSVQDGRLSTLDLSTGQRKRLALLHAYLECRPVIVLDEWAADQDPGFRELFYTELLPELRERGHLLVVISHDDRHFAMADRVLRMHEGQLVEEPCARATDAAPEALLRMPKAMA